MNGISSISSNDWYYYLNSENNNGKAVTSSSTGTEETAKLQTLEEDTVEFSTAAAETEEAASVSGTSSTSEVEETDEMKEISEEIDELEAKKAENEDKMDKIEANIEKIAQQIEEAIATATNEQENAQEEYTEESKAAVNENIQAYIEANKNGEGMTREELAKNMEDSMPDTPGVAAAASALVLASELVNELDDNLSELSGLIDDTQSIQNEIDLKQGAYDSCAEAAAAEEESKCCDPIGFTTTDAEGNEATYDFIVDDGSFDSTSDFLGAEDQWAAMTALDTNGDNIVDAEELSAGNIKAVKTDADGNQTVVDLAQEFGDDFSIDLSSYTEGGSYDGIDTTSDADGDGVADQTLLGTYSLNINGQTVSGYNTLDDTDYLAGSYGVTSSAEDGEGAANTSGLDSSLYSEDLQSYVNFFNTYTEKSAEYKEEINELYSGMGISEEQASDISSITKAEADENSNNFFASLTTEDAEAETEASTTEAAEAGTVTNTADLFTETYSTYDEEYKDEYELEAALAAAA